MGSSKNQPLYIQILLLFRDHLNGSYLAAFWSRLPKLCGLTSTDSFLTRYRLYIYYAI